MSDSIRATWVRPAGVLTFPRLPPVLARNLPWLVLILLSITFAEFLTGSTFVLLPLLNPLSAVFLVGLYGAGVLLIREAKVRWQTGWPTVLLLGAAYGIAEEGLGTKTFFGPAGVGHLAVYGHWIGVNWVWAAELATFHAIFSIALPIAVIALLFPDTEGRSFLPTRRALGFVLATFVVTVAAMFVLFNRTEIPSVGLVVASVAAIAVLIVVAHRAPRGLGNLGVGRAAAPSVLGPFSLGAAFVWGFFALSWIGPALLPVPAVAAVAILAWCVGFGVHLARHREEYGRPAARLDFVLGSLTFSLVLASIYTVFGDFGAPLAVAGVLLLGLRLRAHLRDPMGAARPRDTIESAAAT
ncbi:MAG: hypothetical protein L3K05_04450 [Thermoplasmata archaeon]|nr:hypothetical protein [Thermoplasmata archaeon]